MRNTPLRSSPLRPFWLRFHRRSYQSGPSSANRFPGRCSIGSSTSGSTTPKQNCKSPPLPSSFTSGYKTSTARSMSPMASRASPAIYRHSILINRFWNTERQADGPQRKVGTSYSLRKSRTMSRLSGILLRVSRSLASKVGSDAPTLLHQC